MAKKNNNKSKSAFGGKKQQQKKQQNQPNHNGNNSKSTTSTAITNGKNNNTTNNNKNNNPTNQNLGPILLTIFIGLVAIGYGIANQIHANREIIGSVVSNKTAYTPIVLQPYQQFFGSVIAGNNDINTTHLKEQWNNLRRSIETASSSSSLQNATAIGRRLANTQEEGGFRAKHPVFLIPGFVTSGLELWEGKECAHEQYFRRKIWGSLETFRSFMQDTECWKQHLSLDPITGKDPEGIRLRPSQGFEAADFWTSAFWVWDRIIRNLAAVGYDGSNMDMVSYDWRLSYGALEERDGHFSKLKTKIESYVEYTGEKAVLIGHSMGAPKVFFFLVWVGRSKQEGGGGGGEDWVDKYIHSYIDLAGPMLGLPKAASALLSGDMKETNLVSPVGHLIESLFGRKRRHELFSSWGSLWGMIPKGGDAVWGVAADIECGKGKVPRGDQCVNEKQATGDDDENPVTDIPFLTFTDPEPPQYDDPIHTKYAAKSTWSYTDVVNYLSEWKQGHHGPESLKGTSSWNDPLQHGLPNAPSLNVYCLYGVGLPTERMFYYRRQPFVEGDVPFAMNDTIKDDATESINYGVRTTTGDGSVPLISLGYMCSQGAWKDNAKLNPGNARIVPKEYLHKGTFQVDDPLRQGPESSEHCDILGNHEVLEDIIRIATGHSVEPRIVSNIQEIANEIQEKMAQ